MRILLTLKSPVIFKMIYQHNKEITDRNFLIFGFFFVLVSLVAKNYFNQTEEIQFYNIFFGTFKFSEAFLRLLKLFRTFLKLPTTA